MAVDFKIKDFFYPISILKFRSFLEKSQWFSRKEFKNYQFERLKTIIEHAYKNVPYYRDVFDSLKLKPVDFRNLDDLKKIPVLDKKTIKANFKALTARNSQRFAPSIYKTSGTTGEPVEFYLDKSSKILEFCYYWRHWSWVGYRLGMPFADFSLQPFLDDTQSIYKYSAMTHRLILNPTQISYKNLPYYVNTIKKHKPLFLKGSPSSIYSFAILLEKKGYDALSFKAIFTTGELLLPHQRQKIEKIFQCKILDSYGHMERTVAFSQCPQGTYHIHCEYGILEIDRKKELSSDKETVGRIIGTSLYNLAMPLIRYQIGDLIGIANEQKKCACGRDMPIVQLIYGRSQDIIVTSDGRFLTNIFIVLSAWQGLDWFQLIQEDIGKFTLKIVKSYNFDINYIKKKIEDLKELVGSNAVIDLQFLDSGDLKDYKTKFRSTISKIEIN